MKRQKKPELAAVAMAFVSAVSSVGLALANPGSSFPPAPSLFWTFASGLLEAAYFVTLAKALSRAPLGAAYTVSRGGALLLIWPVSVVLLGEKLSVTAVVGTMLVASGLALVGRNGRGAVQTGRSRHGLAWAAACAVCIAGYHLCYKCAMNAHGEPVAVTAISLSVAGVATAAWHGRAGLRAVWSFARQSPWSILIAGVMMTVSFVAFLAALERGGAGAIMTLRNTSVLFAQGFAWFAGERSRPSQIGGVVAVVVGAICIAWP